MDAWAGVENGRGGCHEGLGYVCTLSQMTTSLISAPVRAAKWEGLPGVFCISERVT